MPSLHMEDEQLPEVNDTVSLCLANVAALTSLLQAVKPGAKQVCCISIGSDGFNIRWEDDSKTLQSAVFLRPELFTKYEAPAEQHVFGVQLAQLVDSLSVFASSGCEGELQLVYPGPDGELQLQMQDPAPVGGVSVITYARISCQEADVPADLTDYWSEPASYFLAPGALLKEAVEDLEWPSGPVQVLLHQDPLRITLSGSGTGSLEVDLPVDELSGHSVAQPRVAWRYKYKNLRAALAHIPSTAGKATGGISTKISIDDSGLLKVAHRVVLGGSSHGGGTGSIQPSAGLSLAPGTQAGPDAAKVGVLQFVTLPLEEEEGGS